MVSYEQSRKAILPEWMRTYRYKSNIEHNFWRKKQIKGLNTVYRSIEQVANRAIIAYFLHICMNEYELYKTANQVTSLAFNR